MFKGGLDVADSHTTRYLTNIVNIESVNLSYKYL